MPDYRKGVRPPWAVITLCFVLGLPLLGAGNADRVFWQLTSSGEPVPGRIVETRSHRVSPSDGYLTFTPRVEFTDPGGVLREMSVKSGSSHYNFRKGDRVTVLWRAQDQSIAIQVPFKRHLGLAAVMWTFTFAGAVMVLASIWFIVVRGFTRISQLRRP
ncbi:DUF3592 domain-containing protein [Litoreibacter arenae]|uniref:DUF3592 domain-containing protein n=1 Tax=Litoreibacter arenae DSM 19593 TaxID=1123360 RepID=S9QFK6_9RHOB|nr:DUF3592 domain-containing protein [Litoreibacter arenae]EPX80221.1 hypothetical protein thalar_01560 [Litoreibacter arenae DSM 19593]